MILGTLQSNIPGITSYPYTTLSVTGSGSLIGILNVATSSNFYYKVIIDGGVPLYVPAGKRHFPIKKRFNNSLQVFSNDSVVSQAVFYLLD